MRLNTVKELRTQTDSWIRSNRGDSNDFIVLDIKGTEFGVFGIRVSLNNDFIEPIDGGCPTITQLGALCRPKKGR